MQKHVIVFKGVRGSTSSHVLPLRAMKHYDNMTDEGPVRLLWYSNQCPSSNLTTHLWWNRAEQPGWPAVLLHTLLLPLADCQRRPPPTTQEIQWWRQRHEGVRIHVLKIPGLGFGPVFWNLYRYEIYFFTLIYITVSDETKSNKVEDGYSYSLQMAGPFE